VKTEHEQHPDTINRETLTVEEAAKVLGIGRNAAYRAIHTGEIPALRIGRRLLVLRAKLDHLLGIRDGR
jgi:excisionase family DNA binding protein